MMGAGALALLQNYLQNTGYFLVALGGYCLKTLASSHITTTINHCITQHGCEFWRV
jgi:hypothetical protein